MNKKTYQAPRVHTIEVVQACGIMAASGSGDTPKVTIKNDDEISSGFVGAKGFTNNDLWEDD